MPATTAQVGMPGESLGPGYAGCIVNAEATLPRAQTATPRPRRPLSSLILKWFGIACLMVAAGLGGYIGWLLWGTGPHDQGRPERPEAGLHAGHRHEGPGAGSPRGRAPAAPCVGLRRARDPADRPRPDRGAGDGRGVAQEGAGALPRHRRPVGPDRPGRHRRPPHHVPRPVLQPGRDADRRHDHAPDRVRDVRLPRDARVRHPGTGFRDRAHADEGSRRWCSPRATRATRRGNA